MAVVYRHRKAGTQEVFYIGIGNDIKRAYSKKGRNKFWENIIHKHGYEVDIIFYNISRKEACEAEILLIKLYGRRNNGTGCLVNLTDGGETTTGYLYTDEHRRKISEAGKGRIITEDCRNKISKANKGKKRTPQQLIKHSINSKAKGISDKMKAASIEATTKIVLNVETGIYYTIKEATIVSGICYSTLNKKLKGSRRNNTSFIYV